MVEQHAKALVPEIRFAGFTDPWEQRKLGEELGFLRSNTLSRAELSDSEGAAFDIHYGDVLIKYGSVLDLKKAKVPRIADDAVADRQTCDCLQDGDVIIADTAEDSAVGKCTELCNSAGKKVFSGLHTMPLRPIREYASGYLGYYLNSPAFHDQLLPLMQGIKVISVSRSAMEDMMMAVPSIAEQASIGAFFDRLDSLITLHQRKYDKLCVLKKSMLDKMFPKGGSLYPEIRFAGFADPWEQRKLGELFEESDERASDREILSVSVANGIYPASESDRETNPGASLANYKIVHFGDVVYNSMRMWQGAVDASRYDGIVSPAYVVTRPTSEVYARFFARLLRQPMLLKQYQQVSQGNSKDTQVLKFDDFASIRISMPASENEQRQIGAFFDRLDSLITLHQRKLELLRNIKKSMLDKMFV
nr:restriction endonuclease subunit S [Bifidobacterium catenulatum]